MSRFESAGGAPREPAFNVPWPVAWLIAVLVGLHALRAALGGDPEIWAFTSADAEAGRWTSLLTYQFVHGGWTHVLMNSGFVLAFGPPTARHLGTSLRAGAAFLAFFLACGVAAAAAYAGLSALLGPVFLGGDGPWALIGASGAASGLMAAAARLIEGRGRLGPLTGRTVWSMTLAWIAINLVLGVSGLTPGAAGVPVAWQAHIFGYLAGLALIVPAGWLAGVRSDVRNDHDIAL
jgi:membrane associated rhomboid family serine protease